MQHTPIIDYEQQKPEKKRQEEPEKKYNGEEDDEHEKNKELIWDNKIRLEKWYNC